MSNFRETALKHINWISTFILTVLSSVSYEFQNYFRHLVLLKMISFEKIFETVTQIILAKSFCPPVARTSGRFALKSLYILKPSCEVSGTRDNSLLLRQLYRAFIWENGFTTKWKSKLTLHDHSLLIIKCVDIPLSLSFPRSFDNSRFCEVNFHFFDTNFCFKPSIQAFRDARLAKPKLKYLYREETLSRLPVYLPSCLAPQDNSGTIIY